MLPLVTTIISLKKKLTKQKPLTVILRMPILDQEKTNWHDLLFVIYSPPRTFIEGYSE